MDKKQGIPFHYYLETTKYVNTKDGKPILSVDPGFPFLMTQYAIMNVRAQTAIPHRNQTLLPVLKDELKNNSSSLPNIVGSLLSIYLLKLNEENIRLSQVSVDNKYLDYFNHFKRLLELNYSKTRDAKVYASDISISYKHLNEVCKEVVKTTAKSFIDSYVILEAKRMLVSTSLSAKEIAFSLGFDEPTNFLKYFKKHTSLTPVEFRSTLA